MSARCLDFVGYRAPRSATSPLLWLLGPVERELFASALRQKCALYKMCAQSLSACGEISGICSVCECVSQDAHILYSAHFWRRGESVIVPTYITAA